MYTVVKRDGKVVNFNLSKIRNAIIKAFDACDLQYNDDTIDFLALKVTSDFQSKIKEDRVSVEDIQDSVESVLIKAGYDEVAKAYILYRKQRERMRNMSNTLLDYKKIVDNYLKVNDWRVKENSTVTYSVGGLILSNSGAITANYWLSEVYDEEIADAHRNADIHLHDLSMLTGYCAGWSLKQLIQEGLGGVTGKITSAPAKHLATLCNQMVNFLGIMQNEWAGAQAFSSFDTYLAPFVKCDNMSYDAVKKCIESFIFGVNTPSRWGTQAPFSNITLDWVVPPDLAEQNCIVGGKEMDFKYKDCQHEMDIVNKAFIETMIEGDANGRGFQYPIPTYSITRNFDWSDTENNRLLFEMTSKYGTPYFSNYVNSDMEPTDVRSMCCRLRLDLRELRKKSGGFFGSGESTGSVGVVTINMPSIAYQAANEEDFYRRLDRLMDISARSLKIKRRVITQHRKHILFHDPVICGRRHVGFPVVLHRDNVNAQLCPDIQLFQGLAHPACRSGNLQNSVFAGNLNIVQDVVAVQASGQPLTVFLLRDHDPVHPQLFQHPAVSLVMGLAHNIGHAQLLQVHGDQNGGGKIVTDGNDGTVKISGSQCPENLLVLGVAHCRVGHLV